MSEKTRIGIMGGTFNPIHIGHLITGECAFEQCGLDKVLFMPSKTPPHKKEVVSGEDRVRMVQLSIEGNPHFELSMLEFLRTGTTYTVDTLKELKEVSPDKEFFFIIGADSLLSLDTWKKPEEILQLSTIVVASRDGMSRSNLEKNVEKTKEKYGGKYKIIDVPTIGISSSMIREISQRGKSIRYYVKDTVRDYIEEKNLYHEILKGQ